MKLPNREKAYIPAAKLLDYLLSLTHAEGKAKAKFLRGFGYDESNVTLLEQGLLSIARSEDVTDMVASPHGTKYVIEGILITPFNRAVQVRTVWIIDAGHETPRFVTAYPL